MAIIVSLAVLQTIDRTLDITIKSGENSVTVAGYEALKVSTIDVTGYTVGAAGVVELGTVAQGKAQPDVQVKGKVLTSTDSLAKVKATLGVVGKRIVQFE